MKKKTLWIVLGLILVVTLAAGILLMGREVSVTVDGKTVKVQTYALTVRQLLHQMGYDLTASDSVEPAADTWLADNVETITLDRSHAFTLWVWPTGTTMDLDSPAKTPRQLLEQASIEPAADDVVKINGAMYGLDDELPPSSKIVIQYLPAIPISVTRDGKNSLVRSAGTSIGKALWNGKIHLTGAQSLSIPFSSALSSAQEITLIRPTSLAITVDGMTLRGLSSAATVGEALQANGILLQGLDYSTPSEDSPLPENGAIRVVRVREEIQVDQESVPFKVKYQGDDTLDLDQRKELTAGQYGIEVTRSTIRYEDGKETSRETDEKATLSEPVDQVIAYGTKISLNTLDTEVGTLTYYRKATVYVTSYSPCRSAPADGSNRCITGTASGAKVQKGIIATTTTWYSYFQGDQIYVPGYGVGTVADTGGGISGKYWIDLGYSDSDWQQWGGWVTIYFLAPAPANVPGILP